MRIPAKLLALFLLAACGNPFAATPPENLNDACDIVRERPRYLRAMKAAERRYGVPVPAQMAVIYQESKFVRNARPPKRYLLWVIPWGRQSSAYGYAQALDGTWEDYKQETGRWFPRRTNIRHSADFIGWYFTKTKQRNGISLYDTRNQYLNYHEGHAGYRRGSYKSKTWLVRVANDVDRRAIMYERQLVACGKR